MPIEKKCAFCNRSFSVPPSASAYSHCSSKCRKANAALDRKYTIDAKTGCWNWTGAIAGTGYGSYWREGIAMSAHRASYERYIGTIPEDMQIDHLCRNRRCINPNHLEVVTPQENSRRVPRIISSREAMHCQRGHEWNSKNTYYHPSGKYRSCRTCARMFRNDDKRRTP